VDREAGAHLLEVPEVSGEVHVAFSHRGPLHTGALLGLPDRGIAQARGGGIGTKALEAVDRVFEGPKRVAGIEVRAHEVAARRLDQTHELSRVQVAGVVLHRDLDAEILGSRSERREEASSESKASRSVTKSESQAREAA
jgi:hypothetical protein